MQPKRAGWGGGDPGLSPFLRPFRARLGRGPLRSLIRANPAPHESRSRSRKVSFANNHNLHEPAKPGANPPGGLEAPAPTGKALTPPGTGGVFS